ncbi:DUF421 domain-containing protein [Paenibacillus mendelii]|uniref:DUF421 domain-containing protein n=1 Tax=Paenibacillus mendelii TaxID=206163 RepID=A0ABV6J968_9BACL|nr:DUF421 domain-containing protein [Paenibacillus mendelii]MCQ6559768.1 DUF421 domain-containing protein [Paenibacillus mendelii]
MDHIWEIVWRSFLAFSIMMLIARIIGKPTVAQLSYHDFVAAITLGAITANLAFNLKMSGIQLIVALATFSGIAFALMVLTLKSKTMRRWFSGEPTVLMEDGKILENNMKKLRINLDMLNQELREKNIFNIEEVQYAVLELNGKLSVLRKPEYLPVVYKDLNMPSVANQSFPVELIMDGQLMEDNLRKNGIRKEWLLKEIQSKGHTIDRLNYAAISSAGKLYVDAYDDGISHAVDRE